MLDRDSFLEVIDRFGFTPELNRELSTQQSGSLAQLSRVMEHLVEFVNNAPSGETSRNTVNQSLPSQDRPFLSPALAMLHIEDRVYSDDGFTVRKATSEDPFIHWLHSRFANRWFRAADVAQYTEDPSTPSDLYCASKQKTARYLSARKNQRFGAFRLDSKISHKTQVFYVSRES